MTIKNPAKEILDRYATAILRQSAIFEKNGTSIPNLDKVEDYTPESYKGDEVLWIPPKDCIRIEFEHDDTKTNIRCIRECESAAKALGLAYCITEHTGGKSPYFNMFNIKGLPVNEDGPIAKNLLIDLIMPEPVKAKLDRSNIGWTHSPVIGHPHWKKKYNGALHKIIRGKNPLEHENEYPKELLKQIKKSKTRHKYDMIQVQQSYSWVSDFLINYCTEHKLPVGNRNRVIEKNLAVIIVHHKERDIVMAKYLKIQERKHNSLTGWFNKVIKGEIKEVNPLELKKYIQENNINYTIPTAPSVTSATPVATATTPITTEEQQILSDPKLVVDTVKEIGKEVAGEEDTIISEIIVVTTRLVKDAIPESKNLFLSDVTGIGKDYVTKKTLEVIVPEEDHLHVTKMTPESFTYWHAFEDDWDWNNKVIHLEDVIQALLNCSTFKTMASGGSHAVVVKEQKTIEIPINGKPVMIPTSHHANPEDEALRRFPIGLLDNTEEQTKRIKEKISKKYTGEVNIDIDCILRSAVQHLEAYSVIIPYAGLIQFFFPEDILMRTHYQRFLDYICSSAVFHQYQREKTEDGKLIATSDDYMIARLVLIYTTSNPKMIPMSTEYRNIIEIVQSNFEPMTVNEIFLHPNCYKNKRWLYRHLPGLCATKIIGKSKRTDENANKDVNTYYFSDLNVRAIPTWNAIVDKIRKIDVITDKTDTTKNTSTEENGVENRFCQYVSQLSKQVVTMVLKPLNREVVTVMTVLTQFLRQRDEKRYEKYYEEPEKPEKTDMALHDKLKELRKTIEENRKAGYKIDDDFLSNNFDPSFISQCIESGQLIRQANGQHVFGG